MSGYQSLSHDSLRALALALRLSHPFRGESVRASHSASNAADLLPGQEHLGADTPAAVIEKVVRLRREQHDLLVVRCPFCDRRHTHGSAGGHGLRLSHCRDGAKPYRLVRAGEP
jgi:hypothetical protein